MTERRKTLPPTLLSNQEDLFEYAERLGFGDLHFKVDAKTGLKAIIAIHSTKNGPALGGCRFIEYPNTGSAIVDAMRLARGMSYKAALVGLPLGGGKAVLLKPQAPIDRDAYFTAYAQFVNELNGRYITAVDSGTHVNDMDIIYKHCPYVASGSHLNGSPSPSTADGVIKGIKAAIEFKLKKTSFQGLHVAIQGVGEVGHLMAKTLNEGGATLTITDTDQKALQICQAEFGATVVGLDEIHKVKCDVFSPCALGAVINDQTINEIQAPIVAGCANNQLARARHGRLLHERGILYAPDYVINSGGLIYAASKYFKSAPGVIQEKLDNIYTSLLEIFERSARENIPTSVLADTMAKERI